MMMIKVQLLDYFQVQTNIHQVKNETYYKFKQINIMGEIAW